MQLNNLLLSLAVPAAGKALTAATQAASQIGNTFANLLGDARSTHRIDKAHAPAGQFSEELAHYAEDLRDYLGQNGILGSYRIRFQIDSAGDQAASVTGNSADQVVDVLSKNRTWLGELRKIAALGQADRGDFMNQQLNIEISDTATSHWAAA